MRLMTVVVVAGLYIWVSNMLTPAFNAEYMRMGYIGSALLMFYLFVSGLVYILLIVLLWQPVSDLVNRLWPK